MADGAFHAAGRSLECLGHLGIQHLGDGIDHIHIVHRQHDRLTQILIALNVCGDTDLVDDGGHHSLQRGRVGLLPLLTRADSAAHMLQQRSFRHRLGQEEVDTQLHGAAHRFLIAERRSDDHLRCGIAQLAQLLQHAKAIQPG